MNIERILVAVNSPDGRDAAFNSGLALASSSGAELYVLHAVPVDQRFPFRRRPAAADDRFAPTG